MEKTVYLSTAVFFFGAIIGSFLTACIYRLPLGKYEPTREIPAVPAHPTATLSSPKRSFCPNCGGQLKWWHNIPILSWVILGGKCSYCSKAIPFRYPLVELITASCALLTLYRFGPTPTAVLVFVFLAALIVITFIDIDYMIIPNSISLPGTVIAVAIGAIQQFLPNPIFDFPIVFDLTSSVLGILAGAGFLYCVAEGYLRLRKREGLGLGDVKLLALIGALLGPRCALFTIISSSVVALLVMLPLIVLSKRGFQQHLPFGPYIAFGAFLFIFFFSTIFIPFSPPIIWWISVVPH